MSDSRSDSRPVITSRSRDRDLEAYRRIGAAVLWRAALDARHADARGARARAWLERDPWAGELLASVDAGVDRRRLAEWIEEQAPLQQRALAM